MNSFDAEELFYSGPMTISFSLQQEIRKRLVQLKKYFMLYVLVISDKG